MITIIDNDILKNELKKRIKEIIEPYYISDPELFELYKKSIPPPEAYYYFPKGEEVIIPNEKKPEKAHRRIFSGFPYSDIEKKWIIELKNEIASHPEIKLPEYWNDSINLRFVYATECNIKKSCERLIKYLNWYRKIFPMTIQPGSKLSEILNLGFLYVYGRDHQFRPILICQPYIYQKNMKLYQEDEVITASVFLFQFIVNNMLIPGQIENWILIINFEGISPLSLPEAVKKLIKTLSDNFIARLYKCYVLGMSFIINFVYKIISNFLEEITLQKIAILDNKNINILFKNIRMDNIEQKFGGTAPNISLGLPNCLFPPHMPSPFFLKEEEDPNKILITQEEYINLIKNNKIREDCISPYIKELLERKEKQIKHELQVQKSLNKKEFKFQNEFEEKNKLKNLNKSDNNFMYDLKSFNKVKNSFHKSINLISDNK